MEQVLFGGYFDSLDTTNIEYNSLFAGMGWNVTLANKKQMIGTDGIIKKLRVELNGDPGVDKKYVFTVMLNGSPTALEVEIAGIATSGNDMVHEIDVTGGDKICLRCDPDATPDSVQATWTTVFEGDTANESILPAGSYNTVNKLATEYGQLMCSYTSWSAVENDHRQVCPTAGIIKKLYVALNIDPGIDPDAYRFTVRKNGEDTSLTVTITANDTTGFDIVNSFAVAAGDILTISCEPLNTPSAIVFAVWGCVFVATVDGESVVLGGSSDNLPATATEYNFPWGYGGNSWNNTPLFRVMLGQVCTLKKLYMLLSAVPGAGKSFDFHIRIAQADSNVTVHIHDTDTTGNSAALEDTVANDEDVEIKVNPTGTPDTVDVYWGFVCFISPGPPPEGQPYIKRVQGISGMMTYRGIR